MKKVFFICICFAFLLFSHTIMADGESKLTLLTDKTDYLPGEPVTVYVSLENTSSALVQLPQVLNPESYFVRYQIKPLSGNQESEVSFRPWALKDYVSPFKAFAPGEIVRTEIKLFYGAKGWTFTEPGIYEITAQMEKVRSNTLIITIHEPSDAQATEAARLFLKSSEVGLFLLFEGGDFFADGIQRLQQVITQYPDTPHAAYARQALGVSRVNDFANFVENVLRPEDPEGAIVYLEAAKEQPASFYNFLHTYLSLYEAYTKLGDDAKAQAILGELVAITTDSYKDLLPFLNDTLEKQGLLETGNPYIVAGTDDNKILIYSPTGNLEKEIAAIANKLATLDSDEDGMDEIAASDGSNVAIYEFNGQTSDPNSAQDSVFTVKADVNGDGTEETIIGAQEANEVSVEGVAFAVFDSVTETRRATRKNEKVTICHKGQTKLIPEPAVEAHLGHGDTLGACGSGTNDDNQGNDDDDDENTNDDDNGTGNNDSQVTICHIPPGNPSAAHTLSISVNALPAHLGHGDTEGACPDGDDDDDDDDDTGDIYGVNVAAGDFDGDETAEIVAAMASNGGRVEIRAGDGTLINGFEAFDSTTGVLVAVGDVTENGHAGIIAGEVNGTEIRIFAANGTQIGSFPVNGNIISLAVGKTIDEFGTPATTEDDSSTIAIPDEPLSPTTGTISGISENYAGQTITDATIESDSSLSEVKVDGDTSNEGLLSNATVLPEGTLTGGTLTGYIENQGTITDTTFVGAELTGGKVGNMTVTSQPGLGVLINVTVLVNATVTNATVSGEIDNQGTLLDVTVNADTTVTGGTVQGTVQNAGTLAEVSLAEGTHVAGGTLSDKIAGDADDKALIENAVITDGTELSDVIIGKGTELADNVDIGEGVRFANDAVIPEGADLTDAISKVFVETLPAAVDMGTDVVTEADAPSLLEQVNNILYFKDNNWQLTQEPKTGQLQLTVGDVSYAVIPVGLKQHAKGKKPHDAAQPLNPDNSVNFMTAKGREILGHPIVQDIPALNEALAQLEMGNVKVLKSGVVRAKFKKDSVAARADIAAYSVSDDEPLGLFPTESDSVRLVFVDDKGKKRAQLLHPFCAEPQALYDYQANVQDGSDLELAHDGSVSLTIEGQRYHGIFDYVVRASEAGDKPEIGELAFTPIVEEGKTVGFTVIYPTGDTQLLRLMGDANP